MNNIWNFNYIQQQAYQNPKLNQDRQLVEALDKLHDFLDSYDDIKDSNKKDMLTASCCAMLCDYLRKHNVF